MTRKIQFAIALFPVLALVGCKSQGNPYEQFVEPSETRSQAILDRQVQQGARHDAQLYDMHFDGTALNSLGVTKLTNMLATLTPNSPLTVYLRMTDTKEAPLADRRAALQQFFVDAGLRPTEYAFVDGVNPNVVVRADRAIDATFRIRAGNDTPGGQDSQQIALPPTVNNQGGNY
jgi:hypothetical protein